MTVVALWVVLATGSLFRVSIVIGESMEPTLQDRDRVIVDVWTYNRRPPRPGEIVLLSPPGRDGVLLVKRVIRVLENGELWVEGDRRAASSDSREWGSVARERVVGRVVCRYWPIRRAGALPVVAWPGPPLP
jgi:nickel-type superoxide dismutase maturation protease